MRLPCRQPQASLPLPWLLAVGLLLLRQPSQHQQPWSAPLPA